MNYLLTILLFINLSGSIAQENYYRQLPVAELSRSSNFKVEVKQGNTDFVPVFVNLHNSNTVKKVTKAEHLTAFGFNPGSRAKTQKMYPDTALSTEQKQVLVKKHSRAFQALDERIRDPYVMLGPDGYYYLTGTTAGSHWGDTIGIHLWRSRDLALWEDLGFVWDLYKDGRAEGSWHFNQTIKNAIFKNPLAVWAPEIHYLNGTWWIPHSLNVSGHSLLRSSSGKPEGPYEVLPPAGIQGIDPHLFQEKDGTTYYMYGADKIVRMDKEMKGITQGFKTLEHKGRHPLGYEGILMIKIGDKYIHIASGRYGYEPSNTYDLYYAVAKDIDGPYGERRMAIKNAGHGNLFQDIKGRWWSTAFDHEFTNKWSLWLVPVDIKEVKDDIVFKVKDDRFRPLDEDQQVVKQLAIDGVPEKWKGKSPWWMPEK